MSIPLAGIRVLDFSRIIAGPLATQHLADLGAEVIKIENPITGDEVRGWDSSGQPGISSFFTAFNRSKKSVAIDLKTSQGQALVHELVKHCDVLVENFRPGVMSKFGLNESTLRSENPGLIYVSISAYGASGSMSDRPGLDPVLQAESGMMAMTGFEDGPPLRHPLSIIDTLTAVQALSAISVALYARASHGRGDFVDLALYDTAIGALNNAALGYLTSGDLPPKTGNSHMQATPVDLFQTKTEPIYMAVGSDRLFLRFCEDVMEQPDLAIDERFKTPADRRLHRNVLKEIIESVLKNEPADFWVQRLRHLPAGKVRSLDDALRADETRERDMLWTINDGDRVQEVLGSPFKFDYHELSRPKPPPQLGADTRSVLQDLLELTSEELDDLHRRQIIR
ncbi:MAG: CoA transferase [Pseudomonadales bacterium]|nr:CoA transferase [Pseudomonadales bacterium]